jgi:D-alanyl-D-alanine carboxypeptidase (penicillin-binding protein 5/6)
LVPPYYWSISLSYPQETDNGAMSIVCNSTRKTSVLEACLLAAAVAVTVVAAPATAMDTKAREAYLIDFETGSVLYDKNGHVPMPPSSMSKLMTTVMVFERLREGSLSFDDVFRVSQTAWRKGGAASGGSTMFLDPNSEVRVEDLLNGVIIQSGNDACIVLAENLMGTEEGFADSMNKKAKEKILMNYSKILLCQHSLKRVLTLK